MQVFLHVTFRAHFWVTSIQDQSNLRFEAIVQTLTSLSDISDPIPRSTRFLVPAGIFGPIKRTEPVSVNTCGHQEQREVRCRAPSPWAKQAKYIGGLFRKYDNTHLWGDRSESPCPDVRARILKLSNRWVNERRQWRTLYSKLYQLKIYQTS